MEISDELPFGVRLRVCRVQRGWSQYACSFELGVTSQTWSNWELGKSTPYKIFRKKLVEMFPELTKKVTTNKNLFSS